MAKAKNLPERPVGVNTGEDTVWEKALEGAGSQDTDVSADRKSTRLNSSHSGESRMPSSA